MKIKFELDDKKWVIENIKIRDYYKIKTDLLLNDTNSRYNIISVLSGCPVETLREFTLNSWNELWENLEIMLQVEMFNQHQIVHQFVHDGVEYGLLDFDKMTIGEFADLDVIVSDMNADSRLHEILAVLYRPIIEKKWHKNIVEKYDYDGFKHRCEVFLDLPISTTKAISAFFLNFAIASLKTTEIYLKSTKEMKKLMETEARAMLQKGGTSLSSDWLTTILSRYQGLQNLELEKHLTSSPTEKNKLKNQSSKVKQWLNNIIK